MVDRAEWAIETTVKLSKRYTVTMTFGPSGSTCEWDPDLPKINQRPRTRGFAGAYR